MQLIYRQNYAKLSKRRKFDQNKTQAISIKCRSGGILNMLRFTKEKKNFLGDTSICLIQWNHGARSCEEILKNEAFKLAMTRKKLPGE